MSGAAQILRRYVADQIADEDIASCAAIGRHGLEVIRGIHERAGSTVNLMTHCNAGSLATINYGTATAPIYFAQQRGIDVHV